MIMVKNSNGKWRMCVDVTDLNNACLKDSFPLPRINQLVDSMASHELLTFMDAFSGYKQILMKDENQDKTAVSLPGFILLQSHAVRTKEHRSHLSKVGESDVQ